MLKNGNLCVLMCCSDIRTVKGGMVTVTKNFLKSGYQKNYEFKFVPTHRDGYKWIKSLFFAKAYVKIFLLLLRGEVDVAHLHMAERGSFYRKAYVKKLCHFFQVPVIFHHHSAEFEDFYESLSDGKQDYVREVLETADLNLVLSSRIAKQYWAKAPKAKIEVLYNTVNVPEANSYSADSSAILLLGRLGKRKGTYDFLKALKLAVEELPQNIRCYLCGDGENQQVNEMVYELGLESVVAHIGWADDEMKERFFKDTAVHILPSYWEGLPMSILETMAYGIPNISTEIASIPEVVEEGINGFLVQPGDVEALKDRIVMIFKNRELRERLSHNGFSLIQDKFSDKQSFEKLESYYWTLSKKRAIKIRK